MASEEPTHSCNSCDYSACNSQELAQHLTNTHNQTLYQCDLCPFVSRHKTSLDEHKCLDHKCISCEVCGVSCNNEKDLLLHTRKFHADLLTYQDETQRRPKNLTPPSFLLPSPEKVFDLTEQANALYLSQFNNLNGQHEARTTLDTDFRTEKGVELSMELMPQKFKRQYQCSGCEYRTFSPRDYLYHRRDTHFDSNAIYECHLCIYATKHLQKLGRHSVLVHKMPMPTKIKPRKKKPKPVYVADVPPSDEELEDEQDEEQDITHEREIPRQEEKSPIKSPKTKFFCSKCDFESKSKFLLSQHEKTVHLRNKFFRCLKCGFVTNERGRYNKHVKYHNLPILECTDCEFSTPYRWNLERHLKNHQPTAGKYKCKECSFNVNSSRSIKTHLLYHHKKSAPTDDMGGGEDVRNGNIEENDNDDTEVSNNEGDQDSSVNWRSEDEKDGDDGFVLPAKSKVNSTRHSVQTSVDEPPKYPCPLCPVVFRKLPWLARHLSQKHDHRVPKMKKVRKTKVTADKPSTSIIASENSDSEQIDSEQEHHNFKTAINLPQKSVTAVRKSGLKTGKIGKRTGSNKVVNKLLKNIKRKAASGPPKSHFPTHMCQVCLYKNTLMSEMEKHVLTHCTEKPFLCHLCKFSCRWKGDMKRHILNKHGQGAVATFERSENPLLKYIKTIPTVSQSSEGTDEVKEDLDDYEELQCEAPKPFKKPKTKAELSARLKNEPNLLLTSKFRTIVPPARNKNEGYFQSTKPNVCVSKKALQDEYPLDLSTTKEDSKTNSNLDSLLRMDPIKLPRIQMNSPVLVIDHKEDDMTTKVNLSEAKGIKRSADSDDSYDEGNQFQRYLEAQQNYFYGENDNVLMTPPPNKKIKVLDDSSDIGSSSKKYKCTYCPFMSNTASRFHVHIVQHLNKKPFMCSVCAYRSNWEWDITKHIKIKSSRDPEHLAAQMVITDETGLKNYEKYNKFLVPDNLNTSYNNTSGALHIRASPSRDDTQEQVMSPEDLVETVLVTPEHEDVNRNSSSNAVSQPQSGQVYRCGHCLFKHPDKKVVVSHLGIHFRSKPYKCKLCGIGSSWKHVLLRHVKTEHDGQPQDVEDRMNYDVRGNTLFVSNSTVKNNKDKRSTSVLQCEICPYTTDHSHHMQLHLRQHCPKEGANIKCPYCPFWVRYRKTLTAHLRFHPEANNTGSSYASSVSSQSASVDELGETGPKSKEKHIKESNSNSKENIQTAVAPQLRKYKCESCFFKSDNKSHYLYHKQFHRPNKNAPFKCTYCSYWSCFKNVINKHERTHNELSGDPDVEMSSPQSEVVEVSGKPFKMFKCRFCPMMNKRRSSVKAHESQHSSVKSLKFCCTTCSYQSNSQGVITSHMRLHNDSNVTIADILSESLKHPPETLDSTNVNVSKENSSNNNLKPRRRKAVTYICNRCPVVFKTSKDLVNHFSFHGAKLPFSCTHCDYNARHKPHLHRHMTVHSPDYLMKRENILRNTIVKESDDFTLPKKPFEGSNQSPSNEGTNPAEESDALLKEKDNIMAHFKVKGSGKNLKRKFRCKNCPMGYKTPEELEFHVKLHKSGASHACPKCSYAVNDADMLASHVKIHRKRSSAPPSEQSIPPNGTTSFESIVSKSGFQIISCPLCPAVFNKPGRIDKHLALHGAKNKFTCSECDYSVRLGANLGKHKKVHQSDYNPVCLRSAQRKLEKQQQKRELDNSTNLIPTETVATPTPVKKAVTRSYNKEPKEKHIFQCSHCPYYNVRRDSVISHMNRHGAASSVVACPYCDYGTSTASFLKDHIKLHFQPRSFVKVKAFMKYDQLEIWACNGSKAVIFRDQGEGKKSRFFSEILDDEPDDLWSETESIDVNPDVELKEEVHKDASEITNEADQDNLSIHERNLIEDAIQEGKKLEIVLTDVLTDKNISNTLLALKEDNNSNDYTTCIPGVPNCIEKSQDNYSDLGIVSTEADHAVVEDGLEEAREAGSLILSSIGNDSTTEDDTMDEWPSRSVDTPTDLLNSILDQLSEEDCVKEAKATSASVESSDFQVPAHQVQTDSVDENDVELNNEEPILEGDDEAIDVVDNYEEPEIEKVEGDDSVADVADEEETQENPSNAHSSNETTDPSTV